MNLKLAIPQGELHILFGNTTPEQHNFSEHFKSFFAEQAQGRQSIAQLKETYGNRELLYATLTQGNLREMQRAMSKLHLPYAIQQKFAGDRKDGVVLVFAREHRHMIEPHLMQANAVIMKRAPKAIEQPVHDLEQLMKSDTEQSQSVVIAQLRDKDLAHLERVLYEKSIVHTFLDKTGRVNKDPTRNTYLVYDAKEQLQVRQLFGKEHIQPLRAPVYVDAKVQINRTYVRMNRTAQQDEHNSPDLKQIKSLTREQSERLVQELEKNNVPCVADYGDGLVDILITDNHENKATECLDRLEITKTFESITEKEMQVWNQNQGGSIEKLLNDEAEKRRRKALQIQQDASIKAGPLPTQHPAREGGRER